MKEFFKKKKIFLSIMLIAVVGIGATYAFLSATSGKIKNTFATGSAHTVIEEKTGGAYEKEVSIKNDGDLPTYVRARIIIGGVDQSKIVFTTDASKFTNSDWLNDDYIYILTAPATEWIDADENDPNSWIYYHKSVAPGQSTSPVITRIYVSQHAFEAGFVDESNFMVSIDQESASKAVEGDMEKTFTKDTLDELIALF